MRAQLSYTLASYCFLHRNTCKVTAHQICTFVPLLVNNLMTVPHIYSPKCLLTRLQSSVF